MTTYGVDASIVIERLARESYTSNVQALFRHLKRTDTLLIPEFCLLECTNTCSFSGDAISKATLNDALRIGLTHQLAVYDSTYIALAKPKGLF